MVANVVVSHEAAVGGLSFGLSCRRLVRWRQRGCVRVRDWARAWARAQVVHRTTGPKVQAQEQIWEDRARETKVQAHRGTGAQGQACARGLKIGPQGFCCHGGQRDAVRGCGSLRYVLGSSLDISHALKNRAENMGPSEYVASHDNACTLRNVCLFFLCRRLVDVHSQSRAQKKQQATKCPCLPRSCLQVLLTNMILLEATLLCRRPEVAHGKPRAEHVFPTFPFQACPSSGKPRASNLLALSSVFLDPRSHVHTWSCAGTRTHTHPHAPSCTLTSHVFGQRHVKELMCISVMMPMLRLMLMFIWMWMWI